MIEGKVKKFIFNHHDDVDGWQLADGMLVHFPPHIGHELGEWIGEGDKVYLEGNHQLNRDGESVLFPTYVESQGWCIAFDQKRPRPPKDSWDESPEKQSETKVSNEDIKRELLHIRSMIEAWGI